MIKVIFPLQWVITKYCPVHGTSIEAYEEFSFFGGSLVTDNVLSPKSFLAPLTPKVELTSDFLGCKLPKGYGHVSPVHH